MAEHTEKRTAQKQDGVTENIAEKPQSTEAVEAAEGQESSRPQSKLSMDYVLEQIEKVAAQTEYLNEVIAHTSEIPNAGPGDVTGQSKADAIMNVVRCRETTNQHLLKLYEKMYDDLKPKTLSLQEQALRLVQEFLGRIEPEQINCLLDSISHLE